MLLCSVFLEITRIHYDAINTLHYIEYFKIFFSLVIFFLHYRRLFLNTLLFVGESCLPNLQVLNKLCLCLMCVWINRRDPYRLNIYIWSILRENTRWRGVIRRYFYWHLLEAIGITHPAPFTRLCGSPKLVLIKQSPSHSIW